MSAIEHIFVLMLENRSFDHMLGFSQITGTDAHTGKPTQIDGLVGTESNSYQGKTYTVLPAAPFTMVTDPGHEFSDVVTQLAGPTSVFPAGVPIRRWTAVVSRPASLPMVAAIPAPCCGASIPPPFRSL